MRFANQQSLSGTCNLFCFLQSLVRKECDDEGGESEQNVADFVAVLQSLLVNILCGLKVGVLVDAPTDHGEHRVPYACTESGIEEELADVHTRETSGDADKLAYSRHEASEEC